MFAVLERGIRKRFLPLRCFCWISPVVSALDATSSCIVFLVAAVLLDGAGAGAAAGGGGGGGGAGGGGGGDFFLLHISTPYLYV